MTTQSTPTSVTSTTAPYDPAQTVQRDIVYIAGNVLAVASIAFGSLGVLLSILPVIGFLAIPFCIMGGLWGGIGAMVLYFGKRGSIKLPIIGLSLCGAALVICIIINVLFIGGAAVSGA